MKKVTWFYLNGCPYCVQAKKALAELISENPEYGKVEIDFVEEDEHPEISSQYDYEANPALFIGKEKKYQAHIGESAAEAKQHVRQVLDEALNG